MFSKHLKQPRMKTNRQKRILIQMEMVNKQMKEIQNENLRQLRKRTNNSDEKLFQQTI
ncbi:unnamed protein product (macronuclear) [Paramecium tetraurelia]|uniref:Uncharacterized protein n=1 Tax=Paramecium tetraurelia TaxID=5888 RepID=A0CK76_PARTE|nr:uncharacterized protein GSPATT00000906001 [Paramecium tetraurelia]CAK71193.1 unnamed protein product [Paramecium tetraurelia]|eukprot:XP_001438590.1 hypothetical protein (macronuclear) [Paramecium tetraurelia strain d4-2]